MCYVLLVPQKTASTNANVSYCDVSPFLYVCVSTTGYVAVGDWPAC